MNKLLERANPGVRALEPYEPGKPIEELERELGLTGVIKLASNENPLGPSPEALRALGNLDDLSVYPDGNGYRLKSALAQRHGVDIDWITLGNGSNDILDLMSRLFLTPERAALFSQYAFAVYPIVTAAANAEARVAPAYAADHSMPLGHDLAAFAELLDDDVGLVFIAQPNNPTGTWLTPEQITAFLEQAPAQIPVLLDEAYYDYLGEQYRIEGPELIRRFPNLVVTRTFSKAYGLAALRVGYGISHPAIADLMNRVRQPFNVNSLALRAAEAALADQTHIQASVQMNREGREWWKQQLSELGLPVLPTQANFVSFDTGRSADAVFQAMLRQGVIVRSLASYAMPTYLRITVGSAGENEACLAALKTGLEETND